MSCTFSEWYEPWRCVVLSWSRLKAGAAGGVAHNRTIIVDRKVLAFTYLIKPNCTAVFGFKKTETEQSFRKLKPPQH